MSETETTHTDKFGFLLRTCTRCGGTGKFSYNQLHGDRCYGCGGTGWQHKAGRNAKAAAEYRAAVQAQREATSARLAAGDVIAVAGAWRTVEAVEVDYSSPRGWVGRYADELDGTERIADERGPVATFGARPSVYVEAAWACTITLDGGERIASGTNAVHRRRGMPDVAPYLQAAGLA